MSERLMLNVIDPAAGNGRAERRDAAENRARILSVARELFAVHGAAEVNMADIAAAADVGKGTLYRRYPSKGELAFALLDDDLRAFQRQSLDALQRMAATGVPRLDQLGWFFESLATFTEQNMSLLREMQGLELGRAQRIDMPHFWQYLTVRGLLLAAARAGELPAELDVELLAHALLAPLAPIYFRFLRLNRGYTPEEIGAGLRQMVRTLGREPMRPV
jgi:AcrR family transcriptional regulator